MKGFLVFLVLWWLPAPGRLGAEEVSRDLSRWMPAVLKAPEPADLPRNPLRAAGEPSPLPSREGGCGVTLERALLTLRARIRGVVLSNDSPCVLYGTRIVALGQDLVLGMEDSAGRRELHLRLRGVGPRGLVWMPDTASARVLGVEELVSPLPREGIQ